MAAAGDLRLHRVAPDVYLYRGFFSNSVILRCRTGLVVVDTQVSPRAAGRMCAELKRQLHLPVLAVVNTHYHGDHVGGNAAFEDVPIMGTAACARFVVERDAERVQYAETFGLAFSEIPPAMAPNLTFEGRHTFTIDDEVFELLQVGRAETPDACILHWPSRGVVACGDGVATCDYPFLGVPFLDEGLRDDGEWLRHLEAILRLRPTVLAPGHGPALVGARSIARRINLLSSLMRDLVATTKEEMRRGGAPAEIVARAEQKLRRYAKRTDLEQQTVSQRFAILRCVNNLSPERAGRGWWDDLRPSVLKQASSQEGARLLDDLRRHLERGGEGPGADLFSVVLRRARQLSIKNRPGALALVAAYRESHARDARGKGLMSELLFDGARGVLPTVDATEYVAAALKEARGALSLDADEPLALLTLGCAEVFGAMVLAQPMEEAVGKILRAMASTELPPQQRRKAEFFLGKARQMEGDDHGADIHYRRVLPRWVRPLFSLLPLLRRRFQNYP